MRKTREILRLKWLLKRSHREIRCATAVGLGTISDTATRAAAAQLDWAAVEQLSDDELEAHLYPPVASARRPLPSPAHMHIELRRTGVTLRLLHEEYLVEHADGYGYTQFVEHHAATDSLPAGPGGGSGSISRRRRRSFRRRRWITIPPRLDQS